MAVDAVENESRYNAELVNTQMIKTSNLLFFSEGWQRWWMEAMVDHGDGEYLNVWVRGLGVDVIGGSSLRMAVNNYTMYAKESVGRGDNVWEHDE